ncbi:MAG TPA: hypothetical protein VEB88_03490 [Candidatus Acidoferrales bacterium]|nr:hypothetical protein [Candidatus Acidoferrales bacterium]
MFLLSGSLDDAAVADTVRQALAKHGAIIPPVEVRRVTRIPQSVGGRISLMKSKR